MGNCLLPENNIKMNQKKSINTTEKNKFKNVGLIWNRLSVPIRYFIDSIAINEIKSASKKEDSCKLFSSESESLINKASAFNPVFHENGILEKPNKFNLFSHSSHVQEPYETLNSFSFIDSCKFTEIRLFTSEFIKNQLTFHKQINNEFIIIIPPQIIEIENSIFIEINDSQINFYSSYDEMYEKICLYAESLKVSVNSIKTNFKETHFECKYNKDELEVNVPKKEVVEKELQSCPFNVSKKLINENEKKESTVEDLIESYWKNKNN